MILAYDKYQMFSSLIVLMENHLLLSIECECAASAKGLISGAEDRATAKLYLESALEKEEKINRMID
jgi:hypothetical protein